jgi:hypothetical protein
MFVTTVRYSTICLPWAKRNHCHPIHVERSRIHANPHTCRQMSLLTHEHIGPTAASSCIEGTEWLLLRAFWIYSRTCVRIEAVPSSTCGDPKIPTV